jgi:hypothetical protein
MVQTSIIYACRASTPVLLANRASGDRQPFLLMSEDESGVPTRAKGSTKYRQNGQALTRIRTGESWQEIDHNSATSAVAAIATSAHWLTFPMSFFGGAGRSYNTSVSANRVGIPYPGIRQQPPRSGRESYDSVGQRLNKGISK